MKMLIGSKDYKPEELEELHKQFVATFSSSSGIPVLKHIREFCFYDEPFGWGLSESEMAYRTALKDVFMFIDAMASHE